MVPPTFGITSIVAIKYTVVAKWGSPADGIAVNELHTRNVTVSEPHSSNSSVNELHTRSTQP